MKIHMVWIDRYLATLLLKYILFSIAVKTFITLHNIENLLMAINNRCSPDQTSRRASIIESPVISQSIRIDKSVYSAVLEFI